MTRFVIDAPAAIRIVRDGVRVTPGHQLVAPSLLRSQALSLLYREGAADARTVLDGITTMKIRLLGDRVSRATAWKVAEQLGLDDTPLAEYLAVAQLQADALIALDPELVRLARGVVPTVEFEALAQ
jgi:hypothetical protein